MNFVEPRNLDWSRLVRPGDRIVCSHMTSEPVALLRALAESGACNGRFDIFLGVPLSDAATAFPRESTFTTYGGMGSGGALQRTHVTQVSMRHYSQCARAFTDGDEPVDVAFVSLARSADGAFHLGAAHGHALAAARRARCIVAEINMQAPVVIGAPWPQELGFAAAIEVAYPLATAAQSRVSDVERRIAEHVAPLVHKGACLQVGIGSLPSAVLEMLSDHEALGLHSGMLTPALWKLVEYGAIDNSRKAIDTGISVTGCVFGDPALYAAVHLDPRVNLRPPSHTHSPEVIAQLDRFTAINSALEIDLLGQMNSETVPGPNGTRRQVGGVGGLNDFIRASRRAPNGLSIVALPSRQAAREGAVGTSRIVAALGGPATVAASDADVVVTEHGVARLRDATLAERARRLIAIAHPDDRDVLLAAARRSGQLS